MNVFIIISELVMHAWRRTILALNVIQEIHTRHGLHKKYHSDGWMHT
jgi:hypothetical protein